MFIEVQALRRGRRQQAQATFSGRYFTRSIKAIAFRWNSVKHKRSEFKNQCLTKSLSAFTGSKQDPKSVLMLVPEAQRCQSIRMTPGEQSACAVAGSHLVHYYGCIFERGG